jgi:hypothetical protein
MEPDEPPSEDVTKDEGYDKKKDHIHEHEGCNDVERNTDMVEGEYPYIE